MAKAWMALLAAWLALCPAAALAQISHSGGGGGGWSGGGMHSSGGPIQPSGPIVPAPSAPSAPAAPAGPAPSGAARSGSMRSAPAAAGGSWPSHAGPAAPIQSRPPAVRPSGPGSTTPHTQAAAPQSAPPSSRTTIIRDPNFVSSSNSMFAHDHDHGHFFWHSWNGFPFCHYWDPWGVQWFGFYAGPSFYWTQYYGGYWWWYDQPYSRWMYYDPGPDSWTSADGQGAPEAPAVTATPAPPAPPGTTSVSPDGARMVQIVGASREAFLYDRAKGGASTFKGFLAKGVSKARWSGRTIVLELSSGGTMSFSRDGAPLKR